MRNAIATPFVLGLLALSVAGCQPKDKNADEKPVTGGPQVTVAQSRPTILPPGTGVVSYAATVKIAAPAVVNIYTTEIVKTRAHHPFGDDPFFRHFFGQSQPQQAEPRSGLGSGVIVSGDGYILTNNHVVNQANQIVVSLHDGRKAKAKVIGTDPDSDLAVIKIDLKDLPTLAFKTTANEVGDVVLAIGNPFGVGQTVTQGIISGLGRSGLGINTYEDFIQTDAAINPGNSGGALIDAMGNLVGINSAIYSRSGGSMGIGFAIPANLAQKVMTEIIEHGQVIRGWLGVEVRPANNDFNEDGTINSKPQADGALIAGVVRGGPAAEGGIQPGDLVLSLNGETVHDAAQLINRVGSIKPETKVKVVVKRGKQEVELAVVVGKRPKPDKQDDNQLPEDSEEQ